MGDETYRPNVFVVLTDQQRWDTVSAYETPLQLTPNLEEMAERGTKLEHMVSPQPVCGPARACLQTGQYASSHGVWGNYEIPEADRMLGEVFADAGYRTSYVGKWHLGTDDSSKVGPVPPENRGGYEYWRASQTIEHTSHPYEGVVYDEMGNPVEFDGYRVNALTDMAIGFIRDAVDGDRPFFSFLSYPEPHQQNDMGTFVAPDGYAMEYENEYVPPDLREQSGDWQSELPDYYGMCKRIDECVGRLQKELETLDIADETIVLFTSDHGCTFRTRPGKYKRSPHEGSIRVPAILDGPGFNNKQDSSELVSLLDIPPTLLSAADIDIPEAMAGRDLTTLFDNSDTDWRDDVFIQMSDGTRSSRAIRTSHWKYAITSPTANGEEGYVRNKYTEWYLYDLAADPWEQTNLIGRADYQEVTERLRNRISERINIIEDVLPSIRGPEHPT